MNLINKYVWLVDTIYRAKRITFKEIDKKWQKNYMSDGKNLPKRTFHKWCNAIFDLFGIDIENEDGGEYRYFIDNGEDIKHGAFHSWLLNTISTNNLLLNNRNIKDRILLENVPSGQQFLSLVLEAMQENKVLNVTYQSFWKNTPSTFDLEPYCIKLFKQRWYLVGRSPSYEDSKIMIYSLDRVLSMEKKEETFHLPEEFSSEEFFQVCYGIIASGDTKIEEVELSVSKGEANYIRSLPLHDSQEERAGDEEHCIFHYTLRPTFDFIQEILSHGADMEVLSPKWLREEIARIVDRMKKFYQKK